MTNHPMDLTLTELANAVSQHLLSPTESVSACLERVAERNPSLNAIAFLCSDRAMQEAHVQTEQLRHGETLGPLAGCPFLVKDLEDVKGLPTSYGSIVYKDSNIAKEDSPHVARLRGAGAIVIGKATCALFGGDAGNKTRAFGATRNPWDPSRTPGGSSGGSAAAVAARIVPMATAADGGGSIRIPAAFCGVFGLKPTFGLVPQTELRQFGMLKFINCVHFGTVTRCVIDTALVLDIVAGYHPADPLSLPKPAGPSFVQQCVSVSKPAALPAGLQNLRIGFSSTLGVCSVCEPDALAHAHLVLDQLEKNLVQGASIDRQFDLKIPDSGLEWVKLMATQERLTVKEAYMKDAERIQRQSGAEEVPLERGLRMAWDLTEGMTKLDDFGAAYRMLFQLNEALEDAFRRVDLIATVALPIDAFPASQSSLPSTLSDGSTSFEKLYHPVFTMTPFNFSGHPACVLRSPSLSQRTGMPLALQLVAPRHQDGLLLQVAAAYEGATGAYAVWPELKRFVSGSARL